MESRLRLHSKYNPQREADRFADRVSGSPLYIVITEPAESYLVASFRRRFPNAKLFAIRYTTSMFLEYDFMFDAVWRWGSGSLVFFLIRHIPDEFFSRTVFLSWKPSEAVWQKEAETVWSEIKKASQTILSVINTRIFFGKIWARNIVNNIFFSTHIKALKLNGIKDSVFLASGASLESFIKDKTVREKINSSFCVCASSSIAALKYAGVTSKLSFATDGGFWAGEHLKKAYNEHLVIPLEAKVPKNILEHVSISFITYCSEIEKYFFSKLNLQPLVARRNGSVSGTAIEFLLENTSGNIFMSGLDLGFSKGFTHTRPNENLENNFVDENRLEPVANILAKSSFNSSSLATYAKWFSSLPEIKKQRLFRIGNEGVKIEGITNLSSSDFLNILKVQNIGNSLEKIEIKIAKKDKLSIIHSFFKEIEERLGDNFLLRDLMDSSKQTIEKEMIQLVAFSDYISLIKEGGGEGLIERIRQTVRLFLTEEKYTIQNE